MARTTLPAKAIGACARRRPTGAVEGPRWDESSVGTNAIGVALELEHPIQVFTGEHFNEAVQRRTGETTSGRWTRLDVPPSSARPSAGYPAEAAALRAGIAP